MKAAFFDFDGTMRKGDSIVHYLLYALKKRKMSVFDLLGILPAALGRCIGLVSLEKLKTRCLAFERRMDSRTLEAFTGAFVREVLMPSMYPDALSAWRRCKEEGALTVLASASTSDYMRPLAECLGADGLICTAAEHHRVTGNCRGREKARRVLEWANHRRIPLKACSSFGNSRGDLDMLALTGYPAAVNPGRRMAKAAKEKGYPIKRWK